MAGQDDGKGVKVDIHLHVQFTVSVMESSTATATPSSAIALGNHALRKGPPLTAEEFELVLLENRRKMQASIDRIKVLGDSTMKIMDKAVQNYRDAQAGWAYPGGNDF